MTTRESKDLNIVVSSLMGVVFGCAIVYIISRLVDAHRKIATLEHRLALKPDDEVIKAQLLAMEQKIQNIPPSLSPLPSPSVPLPAPAASHSSSVPTPPSPTHE